VQPAAVVPPLSPRGVRGMPAESRRILRLMDPQGVSGSSLAGLRFNSPRGEFGDLSRDKLLSSGTRMSGGPGGVGSTG